MSAAMRILVVDGNAPWVRSLFLAMPEGVHVSLVRPYHPKMFRAALGASPVWGRNGRKKVRDGVWDEHAVVAGWTRFRRMSEWMLRRRCEKAVRRMGGCDAAVFVIPQYARIAETFTHGPRVYYAYDPYEFYDWDVAATRAGEDRLLKTCELTAAVSRQLEADFQPRAAGKVVHSPNAVSDAFVAAMRGNPAVPADLAALPGPVVGCTGQINASYDWDLINGLADRVPDATLAFIGSIQEHKAADRARIEATFARPNVKWMGPRDHAALPGYIANFDVCLNPLAVTPHNDRRSPLRLYDYLASRRPVISTAVAEAAVHGGLIEVGRSADEVAALVRRAASPGYTLDLAARESYIAQNTWTARARQFLATLESLVNRPNLQTRVSPPAGSLGR